MPKPTFQRSTITRVLNAAPQLKYVAVYHTNDNWLPSCIGRDWVIPRDSRFPEDHRKMGSK